MNEANEFRKLMEAISSEADWPANDDYNNTDVDEGVFNNKVSPLEQSCRLGLRAIHGLSALIEVFRDNLINKEMVVAGVDGDPDELISHINDMLEDAADTAKIIRNIQKTGKY